MPEVLGRPQAASAVAGRGPYACPEQVHSPCAADPRMKTPLPLGTRSLRSVLVVLLLAALHLRGEDARAPLAEGQRLRDAGEFDAAVAQFRRAVIAAPEDPAPWLLLAETIGWQKRFAWRSAIKQCSIEPPKWARKFALKMALLAP